MIRSPRHERPVRRLHAFFFRLASGKEPVREWLNSESLAKEDRRRIGEGIRTVEYGWPLGMPVCRALSAGLWEVRVDLDSRSARVLFGIHEGRMILLHAFWKKSQATPKEDLRLARRRMRQLETHQ